MKTVVAPVCACANGKEKSLAALVHLEEMIRGDSSAAMVEFVKAD
jgi:hypothetical protein